MFVKISTEHETGGRQPDRLGERETFQTILTASASASTTVKIQDMIMSTCCFSFCVYYLVILNEIILIDFFRIILGLFLSSVYLLIM